MTLILLKQISKIMQLLVILSGFPNYFFHSKESLFTTGNTSRFSSHLVRYYISGTLGVVSIS